MMTRMQILVIDDEAHIRRLFEKELASEHRIITTAACIADGITAFKSDSFDVVLLDMRLPDGSGIDLLVHFQELAPEVQVIVITGFGDVDNAVEAMKLGAYDYITKPFALDHLELIVERAYQRTCLQRENKLLRRTRADASQIKLIGRAQPMVQVRYLAGKVAPTQVPVLLTGESGTGKNVVAQSIYMMSTRHEMAFITKNCGTFQKDLLRSELFGHRKGAFTGADQSHEGLLSFAHNGTLFLDEIGELSPEVQSALLRVIENKSFRRIGEKQEQRVDVRFIFATNRNLAREVECGRFSEALYHRLNVFKIEMPPLRQRKEDIPLLADYFLGRFSTTDLSYRISDRAMQCLMTYNWPGNIREMQNVLERSVILSEGALITERVLPQELVDALPKQTGKGNFLSLQEFERRHILAVLEYVKGNRTQAAEILGIGRKTLYRKLQSLKPN